jgi:hypothetical protein
MKLTKRQRREKKHQQKVRAKVRSLTDDLHSFMTKRSAQLWTVGEAKANIKEFLMEQMRDLNTLSYVKDVHYDADGPSVKLNITFDPLSDVQYNVKPNRSTHYIPFFGDEYGNALKYDGGKMF